MKTNQKLELLKKGIKANIYLVKDKVLPLCAGTSEASKETPTCIFIQKAMEMKIDKEDIMDFLQMDEDLYEKCKVRFITLSSNWKYKQKESLVTNYLKYHG